MRNRAPFIAIVTTGAAVTALPWLVSEFWRSLAMSCMMYITLALTWAMFSGTTRYVSLGTAAFFGLGAYFCAWNVAALPWILVVIGGAALAGIFAGVAGVAILHLRGPYFAVLTFGMAELTRHAVTYAEKQYAGTVGRVLVDVPSSLTVYYTMMAITAAAIGVAAAVRVSRFGLALTGIGSDEQRAETLGVPTRWIKIAAFALTASFAGAVGSTMAVRWTYVDPTAVFNPFIGFQTVLIAMVGGAASIGGPVLAAVGFTLLAEFLRLEFGRVYMILLGVLLIVFVLFLPNGLATLLDGRRARRRRNHGAS